MIINWNVNTIKTEIDKISHAEKDIGMTGFITWKCKKDLYEILWYVEDELAKCSTYADEQEFLKHRDQQKMLKTLGKKYDV